MQDLTITLLQTCLRWHDRTANLAMFSEKLCTLSQPTDLIILPEMFTTGFSMEASLLAEQMEGPAVAWMQETARKHQAVITGSLIIAENGKYYNRLIWMRPDGTLEHYDKKHLFRMAGEDGVYAAGSHKLLVTLKGWNICPLVCYDLRFPVWSRNTGNQYDLLFYVANWPEPRSVAWRTLLQARAIENLAYVVGVNRVGQDGNGIPYSGDSSVIDPKGQILFSSSRLECMPSFTLSKQDLFNFRQKFPTHLDADDFELR